MPARAEDAASLFEHLADSRSLDEQARDTSRGIGFDLRPASETLLIAFGGMLGRRALNAFELVRVTNDFGIKRMFVRDHEQLWYQLGIAGLGTGIQEAGEALSELTKRSGATRVVTVGASAGAYAAILFGALVEADLAVAFAPRSLVGWRSWLRGDVRSRKRNVRLLLRGGSDRRFDDLRRVLTRTTKPVRVELFYSTGHRIDRMHANRLATVAGVVLRPQTGAEHKIATALNSRGELKPLLAELIPAEAGWSGEALTHTATPAI